MQVRKISDTHLQAQICQLQMRGRTECRYKARRNKEKARSDGRWDELVTLMNRYQARPRESQSLEAFIAEQLND